MPEWKKGFSDLLYKEALLTLDQHNKTVSLYIHIPFCTSMCYYCGCNVLIRKSKTSVGDHYLHLLKQELLLISHQFSRKPILKQCHIGGGTPNFLSSSQLVVLKELVDSFFDWSMDAELAIEVDPRTVSLEQLSTIRLLGFNRLSMGIQDFNHDVQKAVNRVQPFELVDRLMAHIRTLSFESVSIDLIYGLPLQTAAQFGQTIKHVITLSPDRIALYSFAHIPWLKEHQKLINPAHLPEDDAKLDIFLLAREMLLENGYDAIGMDHFAKRTDAMSVAFSSGTLYRNFMGYTLKPADEFIGIGVTAIGFVEGVFVQNSHNLATYEASVCKGSFPIEKGLLLTQDDRIRQWVIAEIMCHFVIKKDVFYHRFSQDFDGYFEYETSHLNACEKDGLLYQSSDGIYVTEIGRFFVRNIAMGFDWYLRQKTGHRRFSKTI